MNYVFFGHHKCASTWCTYISYEICNLLGFKPIYFKMAFDQGVENLFKTNRKPTMLISQSSSYDNVHLLTEPFKGFHIIRDPRDIVLSGYFSHMKTHPIGDWDSLAKHREMLQNLDKDEGLLKEFEFSDIWLRQLEDWNYTNENIYEVKMEELTKNPFSEWKKIIEFLGLYDSNYSTSQISDLLFRIGATFNRSTKYLEIPEILRFNKSGISDLVLKNLLNKYSFKKLSKGRKVGQENTNSHYRKGKSGDWRNHFNKNHIEIFKAKYGDLLIKLGYEKDTNW